MEETPGGEIPLGVRVTCGFLNFTVFLLTLPIAGAAFFCVLSVAVAWNEPQDALQSIAWSCKVLGGFCTMLGLLLGANWMATDIRARHEDPERARWPVHPLRAIVKPLLTAVQAYAVCAVLAWLVVILGFQGKGSWLWIAFWVGVVAACWFFKLLIKRYPGAQ